MTTYSTPVSIDTYSSPNDFFTWGTMTFTMNEDEASFSLVELPFASEDTVWTVSHPFANAIFTAGNWVSPFTSDDYLSSKGYSGFETLPEFAVSDLFGTNADTGLGDVLLLQTNDVADNIPFGGLVNPFGGLLVGIPLQDPNASNWTYDDYSGMIGFERKTNTPDTQVFTYNLADGPFTLLTEDDTIIGTDTFDWMHAGAGNDTVDLGGGTDTYSLVKMTEGAQVSLTNGIATIGEMTKTLTNIENITGSSFADFIEGDAGDNVLRGLGGSDWFNATEGDDTYIGGAGNDTVSFATASEGISADLRSDSAAQGVFHQHSLVSIERLTESGFNDQLTGDEGSNILRGLGGNDVFIGSGGGDIIDGGSGMDDVYYGSSTEGVVVYLSEVFWLAAGNLDADRLRNVENVDGSDHDDWIVGDQGRNILYGYEGDDHLFGYSRSDSINGGEGNDFIDGGRGADNLSGGLGNDTLFGGLGNDDMEGGDGDDILTGGQGYDDLYGDDGYDIAIFDGAQSEFEVLENDASGFTVRDLRDGAPLGEDRLFEIEVIRFTDGDVFL